jgi:Flp pilus assembly protein TadD
LDRHSGTPGDTADPRRILQEATARHNVDKNPADFEAHCNLGAMLQGRGDLAGAEKQYAIALSIRPEDATVNNAIAGANLAAGHPDVAVTYLQTALRSRPDYFDTHEQSGNRAGQIE